MPSLPTGFFDDPKSKEAALTEWREEHPKQADPDDEGLYQWLVEEERRDFKEQWREAHPGQPLPDDYAVVRRWAINERNKLALGLIRRSETFH